MEISRAVWWIWCPTWSIGRTTDDFPKSGGRPMDQGGYQIHHTAREIYIITIIITLGMVLAIYLWYEIHKVQFSSCKSDFFIHSGGPRAVGHCTAGGKPLESKNVNGRLWFREYLSSNS